jgi:putative DNA methylase
MNDGQRIKPRKKLIEVALPSAAINAASAREKSLRHGHPSTLHLWWSRKPLAAARAVIFAQLVDDPSSHPERFPTEEAQEMERQRLFGIIEELVLWENTNNEKVLNRAREEIWKSWRATCADNQNHSRAKELFNPEKLPAFHDPFAGGGSLPLEAQRLGLESYASDLNPVAVLISKAMIEIPPKFAGRPPVNPGSRKDQNLFKKEWRGVQGLAEDVRYYGQWMCEEAEKRIGHLYPKVEVTAEMAKQRPDLKPYAGKSLTVIAWIWARTVKSPNPAFAHVEVPLASTFVLSSKIGKEAYVEPVIEGGGYRFTVKVGNPKDAEVAKYGTKLARGAKFKCLMSSTPMASGHIKAEGEAGRMGVRMMAIVAEGDRGRVYLPPTEQMEEIARQATPTWEPVGSLVEDARAFTPTLYGLMRWSDLFTSRQLVALTTFSELVLEARERALRDVESLGTLPVDPRPLAQGGTGPTAYADAVATYLGFGVDKSSDVWCSLCIWANQPKNELVGHVFGRQALPMTWEFGEVNVFSSSSGNFLKNLEYITKAISVGGPLPGMATQADAQTQSMSTGKVVSTDPPYYDNVPYADLSDFFYVWLRRSLKPVFPDLLATLAVPKAEELVVTTYRHGSKEKAETFFLGGMTRAMHRLSEQAHPAFPVTFYSAFKQAENEIDAGTTSTGWETFLQAVISAGFAISGTWPMRTEREGRMRQNASNALASSIVLVCRPRAADAPTATRREFVIALKAELPIALTHLQRGNIAPGDLAQAAIGPGMAVYTRYARVLDAEGKPLLVREALALINHTLDEALAKQEGDFDADSRWALAWFEQYGFEEGEYGVAETLSKAKNTSVYGMVAAGVLVSKGGKVRLLVPNELPVNWDPETDLRLTAWESVHHLIRALEAKGENAAAQLVAKLGSKAEIARELAYRLYTVCERKKRAQEALSYNGLVQSWPEITRLARESGRPQQSQPQLFDQQ